MSEKRLDGRVVLVTGAAQGQGAAHARRLAAEGAAVVLADLVDVPLEALATEIERTGGRAVAPQADVSSGDDWARIVTGALNSYGALHGLVNNAGISSTPGVATWDAQAWERAIAVNQTSVALGMRAVLPAFEAGHGGSIVNVSSAWAHTGGEGTSIGYVATKSAVLGMTKAAALELARAGIRVNSVSPGYIDHLATGSLGNPAADHIPLGRLAHVHEISGAVAFLLSDDASYVTGIDILVDGGMALG